MRAFQDRPLFGSDRSLNSSPQESVLHFAGRYRRPRPTILQTYLRGVSRQKVVITWRLLLGVQTYEFELDSAALAALLEESVPFLEAGYSRIRWHDAVVLGLISKVSARSSQSWAFAEHHLQALSTLNPRFHDELDAVLNTAFGP